MWVIKFNQKAWLKLYIDIGTKTKSKKLLWEGFSQVDEWYSFWKSYGKCEKI